MTEELKRQFKLGFLRKLAERGVLLDDLVKVASPDPIRWRDVIDKIIKAGPTALDLLKWPFQAGEKLYKSVGLVGIPAAAGGLSYVLAKPERIEDSDIETVKNMDLVRAYTDATTELRRRRKVKEHAGT